MMTEYQYHRCKYYVHPMGFVTKVKVFLKSTKAAGKLKFTQNDKFDYNLENDYWIPHSQHKKIIDQV